MRVAAARRRRNEENGNRPANTAESIAVNAEMLFRGGEALITSSSLAAFTENLFNAMKALYKM